MQRQDRVQAPAQRMEIKTIEQEKMTALTALANINVELTTAEGKLLNMKNTIEDYIRTREKMTEERVATILSESQGILNEAMRNYREIEQFYNSVVIFSGGLDKSFERLQKMADDFAEWRGKSEALIEKQEADIRIQKRDLEAQKKKVASDAESNKRRSEELSTWQTRLSSRETSLRNALEVIKAREQNGR